MTRKIDPGCASPRRTFLTGSLAAGAAVTGSAMLGAPSALARAGSGSLSPGDAAILRFLAAAELIEADLWTQYAELGGIGNNPPIEVSPPSVPPNNYHGPSPQPWLIDVCPPLEPGLRRSGAGRNS
jgi:hypothetical protein